MSRPVIIATYWFASSSGNGTHETLEYSDGSTSCSCFGWTKRCDANANRTCKHVRMVEAGMGAARASHYTRYSASDHQPKTTAPASKGRKPVPPPVPGQRKIIIT